MGRFYTASFGAIAVTAIQDVWEVNAPATAIVVIHEIVLGQTSDVSDAAEEILQLQISRSTGTSGSGGAAVTPRPHLLLDTAFAGTVERNNTTQATTTTVIREDFFNVRVGWPYVPTPESRIVIPPSGRVVLELPVAPADSLTMDGSITFEEIG